MIQSRWQGFQPLFPMFRLRVSMFPLSTIRISPSFYFHLLLETNLAFHLNKEYLFCFRMEFVNRHFFCPLIVSKRKLYVTFASRVNIKFNVSISQNCPGYSCVCPDVRPDKTYQLVNNPEQGACLNEEDFDYFA